MTLEEICSRVEAFIRAPAVDPGVFDELARTLFRFQFAHNRPYRVFCESRRVTPENLKSISDIPAIITTAFKDLELTALPANERATVFHSSGTTAHRPSRHFHSARSLQTYELSLLEWFKPNILPDYACANFLLLSPPPAQATHSSLVHMFETVSRKFVATTAEFCADVSPDGGWVIDFDRVLKLNASLQTSKAPVIVCGTAFSFVHLCDFLAQQDQVLTFPDGSRVFETGGYKGRSRTVSKPELHRMISRHLQIPEPQILGEYGMSELSSQAYDRISGNTSERIYKFPHWVRASIISPETGRPASDGDPGLLRVIDLANVASVMAIQTEDLARWHGNGFELMGRATEAETRGCSLMLAAS